MPESLFERSRDRYPGSDIDALLLFLTIRTAARRIENVAAAWLDPYNVSLTGFDVLHLLTAAETGMTVSELRVSLRMTQPNVTYVVNNLERDGLIRRKDDRFDRRSRAIFITKKGQATLDAVSPGQLNAIASALRNISSERRSMLMEMLAEIAGAFENEHLP